ncbi:MAG: hypothetical protein DRI74_09255 [Bacteroidetes bacterium]|nr:MAG: hypothetical protein DRI74_09255 [Bacteroidota bacterium]
MRYGSIEWLEHQFVPLNRYLGDRWGHRWRGSQKLRFEVTAKVLRERLRSRSRQKILDIGCGMGDFTKIIFNYNETNKITAVDISQNALINFIPTSKSKVKLVRAALPNLDFPENTFDGIVALEVVCYLSDIERELSFKNMHRILKPGGWILFSSVVEKKRTRYFTVEDAITLFQRYFDTEFIGFHYSAIFSKIERIPFGAFNKFAELSKRLKNNMMSPLIIAPAVLLYLILSQKWIAKFMVEISKFIFGPENTRSHIILLGTKK